MQQSLKNMHGLIHIYKGRGKGKTTAALGLALRAAGANKKVCLIRFLKPNVSSELATLKKIKVNIISYRQLHPFFFKSASIETLKKKIAHDLLRTEKILKEDRYDVVILDEILYLLEKRLVDDDAVLKIIKNKPRRTELVLTGGKATKRLIKLADYVSTIVDNKHPFNRGIKPRKGIEF